MRPAPTATRVPCSTPDWLNEQISGEAAKSVAAAASQTGAIGSRLQALRQEWDVERGIETEAPLAILAGVALGLLVDRRFLAVPAVAASMLLLHGLQGWYPLLPMLRRAGVRTTREIADEAYALKQRRGDFDVIDKAARPEERAAQAWRAAGAEHGA